MRIDRLAGCKGATGSRNHGAGYPIVAVLIRVALAITTVALSCIAPGAVVVLIHHDIVDVDVGHVDGLYVTA